MPKPLPLPLLLLLPLLLPLLLAAQLPRYHAQVFGEAYGIGVGGGISDLFKDREQFVWVVTANAVQRFDGRNVRTWEFEKSINQAYCAADNRVWVMAGRELWRQKAGGDGFEPLPFDTTGGVQPRAIFQPDGYPECVLTTRGVYGFRPAAGRFERLPGDPPTPLGYTNYQRFALQGTTIFYPGAGHLYAYNVATTQYRGLPVEVEIPYLYALTPDLVALSNYSADTYWYDFQRQTIRLVDPRAYGLDPRRRHIGIMGVAALDSTRYLMTTRLGIFTYDRRTDRFEPERIYAGGRPLELDDALFRLFIDENGQAWAHNVSNVVQFNTRDNGFGLLRNYHYNDGRQWNNRVIGLLEDWNGDLWFAGGFGINRLNLRTGIVTPYPPIEGATDRLSHASVRGLVRDDRYLILGPTDKGVWLFDPRAGRWRRPWYTADSVRQVLEGDFIDAITPLRNGDFVVLGRYRAYRLEARTYRVSFLAFPGDRTNTNAAAQDAAGNVYIGTTRGVYVLDEQYRFRYSVPGNRETVLTIFADPAGALLVGTNRGLRRLVSMRDSIRLEPVAPLADGHTVTLVFRDRRDRYWLGTTNGLLLFDPTWTACRKFDFADNLQGPYFNGHTFVRLASGLVFIGGINGINYFYPEKIELDDRPLTVTFQSLHIEGDSLLYRPRGPLELSAGKNTLAFEVAAPYFNNAGKVQYRYRLHPDEAWTLQSGSHQIRLARLEPGRYRLEVAASINGQQWYAAAEPFEFRIRPPWWQTWPARLLAIGLLAAAVYTVQRVRENRLRLRQARQLEVERLKNTALQSELEGARARLQNLRLQMNPHFLFNALNAIQQMIVSGNTDGAALYLSKFSRLLRQVLRHGDHDAVSLRDELEMLSLYLELEALRFDSTFEYSIRCAPGLDVDEYKVPMLLVQPFVENAIWHGLLHKNGRRTLSVYFEETPGEALVCIVEDNGIGRAAAQAFERGHRGGGKGLRVSAERLAMLNQHHAQQNQLIIDDLHAPDGSPAGTRVTIKLA